MYISLEWILKHLITSLELNDNKLLPTWPTNYKNNSGNYVKVTKTTENPRNTEKPEHR